MSKQKKKERNCLYLICSEQSTDSFNFSFRRILVGSKEDILHSKAIWLHFTNWARRLGKHQALCWIFFSPGKLWNQLYATPNWNYRQCPQCTPRTQRFDVFYLGSQSKRTLQLSRKCFRYTFPNINTLKISILSSNYLAEVLANISDILFLVGYMRLVQIM